MATDSLLHFGLQHAVTGAVLYTLYALPQQIEAANINLSNRATEYRYVRIDGPVKSLPVAGT